MQSTLKMTSMLLLSAAIGGCGLTDMPKKMDTTNSTTGQMNDKMSQMNQQTQAMGDQLVATNSQLGNTTKVLTGMNSQLSDMARMTHLLDTKIGVLNDQISNLNNGMHQQALLLAINNMIDPANTAVLSPVPFDMMPGGQAFARTATADELVNWFSKEMHKLNYWLADSSKQNRYPILVAKIDKGNKFFEATYSTQTVAGKTTSVPNYKWSYSLDYVKSFNHEKDVVLIGMEIVASYIPQGVIEKLVNDNIVTPGLFQDEVFTILKMRSAFIANVQLEQRLFGSGIKNLAQFSEALSDIQALNYIAALPSSTQMDAFKAQTFLSLDPNDVYVNLVQASELAKIVPQSTAMPVTIAWDMSMPLNNDKMGLFKINRDHITVVPIAQNDIRNQQIQFDPNRAKSEAASLVSHFKQDLSQEVQNSVEAQKLLGTLEQ